MRADGCQNPNWSRGTGLTAAQTMGLTMKPRQPKTFTWAISLVREKLSDKVCAQLVGRSTSLVRKWADPDHFALPNLDQALMLDLAYATAGHGKPPILESYSDLLGDALSKQDRQTVDVLLAALSVQGVVGELSLEIKDAIGPKSEDGPKLLKMSERESSLSLLS